MTSEDMWTFVGILLIIVMIIGIPLSIYEKYKELKIKREKGEEK